MPTLSFKRKWIDALLTGDKTQTTRQPAPPGKPPRITTGDTVSIYIEQRGKIKSKPIYPTTPDGKTLIHQKILDGKYPNPVDRVIQRSDLDFYYAHFLGTVKITEVAVIRPSQMTGEDLEAWAWADGFYNFDEGDRWFVKHHSDVSWANQTWDVIRWRFWGKRHYNPTEVA